MLLEIFSWFQKYIYCGVLECTLFRFARGGHSGLKGGNSDSLVSIFLYIFHFPQEKWWRKQKELRKNLEKQKSYKPLNLGGATQNCPISKFQWFKNHCYILSFISKTF